MANPPRSQPTQNLRFVVANDPDQFRDRSIMRNNRSHVMHNHLSEKRQSSSTSSSTAARKASDDIRIRKKGRAATPNRTGSPSIPSDMPRLERSLTDQIISSQEALAIYRRTADSKPRQRNTAISDVNSSGPLDMRGFTDTSGDSPSSSLGSPYASALASSNLFYPVDPRVIKYTRTMRRSTSPSGQWMHATGDPFHDPQRPEEAILTVEVFKDHCGLN